MGLTLFLTGVKCLCLASWRFQTMRAESCTHVVSHIFSEVELSSLRGHTARACGPLAPCISLSLFLSQVTVADQKRTLKLLRNRFSSLTSGCINTPAVDWVGLGLITAFWLGQIDMPASDSCPEQWSQPSQPCRPLVELLVC